MIEPSLRDVLRVLAEHKPVLARRYRLSALGVFGSVVRGEERAESDIDIVFESNEPNLLRTARLRDELECLLGRPVDVVRLRASMNASLREHILYEARYV